MTRLQLLHQSQVLFAELEPQGIFLIAKSMAENLLILGEPLGRDDRNLPVRKGKLLLTCHDVLPDLVERNLERAKLDDGIDLEPVHLFVDVDCDQALADKVSFALLVNLIQNNREMLAQLPDLLDEL